MTADELRAFELRVADAFNAGKIRAPVHLDGGNEEPLINVFADVRREDWVFCTWRSHYKALLHGVPADRVMAEIMAGRSITLCFPEHRFFSSAIVGGNLPIALGVAMGIKRRNGIGRVWAFCGDMTSRTGAFHECMEYAWGHDLPIQFVVEDNGLSVCTDTKQVWGNSHRDLPITDYGYKLPWPHSGAGKRIEF
jgi:TPP-dependent pyruvate/acetoin dehydrogenase alpha subunit